MDEDVEQFLNEGKENIIEYDEPKEDKPKRYTSSEIQNMKNRLEVRKLEIELDKLQKPDTSIDYYAKMLDLQEKHFYNTLEMQKSQQSLMLEIEKLKLQKPDSNDDFMEILKGVLPLLPTILKQKDKPVTVEAEPVKESTQVQEEIQEGEEEMRPPSKEELEEYKQRIRNGEISFEEAYTDFQSTPFGKYMTKEQFKVEYEKIKNGYVTNNN